MTKPSYLPLLNKLDNALSEAYSNGEEPVDEEQVTRATINEHLEESWVTSLARWQFELGRDATTDFNGQDADAEWEVGLRLLLGWRLAVLNYASVFQIEQTEAETKLNELCNF